MRGLVCLGTLADTFSPVEINKTHLLLCPVQSPDIDASKLKHFWLSILDDKDKVNSLPVNSANLFMILGYIFSQRQSNIYIGQHETKVSQKSVTV